jgi:hypothetical protein
MPNAGPALTSWQLFRVAFFFFAADCAKKITDSCRFLMIDRIARTSGRDSLLPPSS